MSAAHSVALARLRLASDGSAIGCSLLLLNRSIGLGWRRCGVRLQALGVARGRRHGLLELANVSIGDAAADLREALGAARLSVAEDLLAKQILRSSDATLPALVSLVLAVLELDGETATLALLARRLFFERRAPRRRQPRSSP